MTAETYVRSLYPLAGIVDTSELQKMETFKGSTLPVGFFIAVDLYGDDYTVLCGLCDTVEQAWEEARKTINTVILEKFES